MPVALARRLVDAGALVGCLGERSGITKRRDPFRAGAGEKGADVVFTDKSRKRLQRATLVALCVCGAAACTPGQALLARRAHTAREKLVGLTADDVVGCAGQPARVQQSGSRQYLTYISGPPAPGSNHTRCVVTFMLRSGYVESVDYENPNGRLIGDSIPECLEVVGPCLPATE